MIENSAAAEKTEAHNGNTCTAPAFGHVQAQRNIPTA